MRAPPPEVWVRLLLNTHPQKRSTACNKCWKCPKNPLPREHKPLPAQGAPVVSSSHTSGTQISTALPQHILRKPHHCTQGCPGELGKHCCPTTQRCSLSLQLPPHSQLHGFPTPLRSRGGKLSLKGSDSLNLPGSGQLETRTQPLT